MKLKGKTSLISSLFFILLLIGCTETRDEGKRLPIPFPPAFISGSAHFEKKQVNSTGLTNTLILTPIRSADVEIFRDADGTVIATGETDSNGQFNIPLPVVETSFLLRTRVIARQVNETMNVRVVDGLNETISPNEITGELYALTSDVFTGPQSGLELLAKAEDSTGRRAGAFNIFDGFIRASDFIKTVDPNALFPPLVFRFKVGENKGTNFSSNAVESPEGIADRIRIGDTPSDTNDFDDSVILHEIGHYILRNFSKSSSLGGTHFLGQRLDPRLAFGEGWATFFAQAILGSHLYIDSKNPSTFTFSLETFNPSTMASSYESESSVGNVLWDLLDTPVDSSDGDTLAMGFKSIWENGMLPLGSPQVRFVYLHSFLDRLKEAGVLNATEINVNFCGAGREDICEPHFNDAFNPASPVSFPQRVIGENQIIDCRISGQCTVDAGTDQFTLAVASDYYRLDLQTEGTLTVDLTVDFPLLDDLDLFLFEDNQGRVLAFSADATGTEQIAIPLPAGSYMIQVLGFSSTSGAGPLIPYRLSTSFAP